MSYNHPQNQWVERMGVFQTADWAACSGRHQRTHCLGRTARRWESHARCPVSCQERSPRCPCSSCRWRPATRTPTRSHPPLTSPPVPPSTCPSKSARPSHSFWPRSRPPDNPGSGVDYMILRDFSIKTLGPLMITTFLQAWKAHLAPSLCQGPASLP